MRKSARSGSAQTFCSIGALSLVNRSGHSGRRAPKSRIPSDTTRNEGEATLQWHIAWLDMRDEAFWIIVPSLGVAALLTTIVLLLGR